MGDGEDGPVAFMDQGWGTGGEGRLVVPLFRTDDSAPAWYKNTRISGK